MEKGKKGNIVFGIFMILMLIAPFIIFGHMAEKKQVQDSQKKQIVSSETIAENSVTEEVKGTDNKMHFTWKTVAILSVGVLAAALRFKRMRQMREKNWDARSQ